MAGLNHELIDNYLLPQTSSEAGSTSHVVYQRGRRRVERWTRLGKIGEGTFGTVFKEENPETAELRAIKEIRKDRDQFHKAEIEALAKFSRHPELFAHFEGWWTRDDVVCLSMEFFDFGDLGGWIARAQNGMPEKDAKIITDQLCQGLNILHKQNFTHRDLKPQNIFIASTEPWHVKLGDFGCVRRLHASVSIMRTFTGTIAYQAPEFYHYRSYSDTYSNAVDMWSLGCILFETLTLQKPFGGQLQLLKSYCDDKTDLPVETLDVMSVSQICISFLRRLLEKDSVDRLSADEALQSKWLTEPEVASASTHQTKPLTIRQSPGVRNNSKTGSSRSSPPGIVSGISEIGQVNNKAMNSSAEALSKTDKTAQEIRDGFQRQVRKRILNKEDEETASKHTDQAFDSKKLNDPTTAAFDNGFGKTDSISDPVTLVNGHPTKRSFALLKAAFDGHIAYVIDALDAGCQVNCRCNDFDGESSILRDIGYSISMRDENGTGTFDVRLEGATALFLASIKRHDDIVDLLLMQSADPDMPNADNWTPLHAAIIAHSDQIVESLCIVARDTLYTQNNDGRTALHLSVLHNMDLSPYLSGSGWMHKAFINHQDHDGRTALWYAARKGANRSVKELVEAGATIDLDCSNVRESRNTALWAAVEFGRDSTVAYLIKFGVNIEDVRLSVKSYDLIGPVAETPLLWAALNESISMVFTLLECGADVEATHAQALSPEPRKMITPLLVAARLGTWQSVNYLLQHGASLDVRDGFKQWSSLQWANAGGDKSVIDLIQQFIHERRTKSKAGKRRF